MKDNKISFPLVDSNHDNKEILQAISILLSGQLTRGSQVKAFEKSCGIEFNMAVAGDKEGLYDRRINLLPLK